MCFASGIRHIGSDHKLIIHRILRLRHLQRHRHVEGTIDICDGLTLEDLVAVTSVTQGGSLPIAAVRPPPEGCATHHLITHLSPLNRHAGIGHSVALHRQCVASGIGLFHLREFDTERRTLILLHTDVMVLTVHTDAERSRQAG